MKYDRNVKLKRKINVREVRVKRKNDKWKRISKVREIGIISTLIKIKTRKVRDADKPAKFQRRRKEINSRWTKLWWFKGISYRFPIKNLRQNLSRSRLVFRHIKLLSIRIVFIKSPKHCISKKWTFKFKLNFIDRYLCLMQWEI